MMPSLFRLNVLLLFVYGMSFSALFSQNKVKIEAEFEEKLEIVGENAEEWQIKYTFSLTPNTGWKVVSAIEIDDTDFVPPNVWTGEGEDCLDFVEKDKVQGELLAHHVRENGYTIHYFDGVAQFEEVFAMKKECDPELIEIELDLEVARDISNGGVFMLAKYRVPLGLLMKGAREHWANLR